MKKIISIILLGIILIIGGYSYYQKQRQEDIYQSLSIEFKDQQVIEYGSQINAKDLIQSVSGTLTAPIIDTKQLGKQTLQFIVYQDDISRTFDYDIEIKDTKKPVITLTEEDITLQINDSFDVTKYIKSVSDPVDGKLPYISHEKVKDEDAGYYTYQSTVNTKKAGDYQVTITAIDQNKNQSQKELNVTFESKIEESKTEENKSEKSKTTSTNSSSSKQTVTTNKNKTICINPGHQAKGNRSKEAIGPGSSTTKAKVSTGATGVVSRRPESLINLEIALKLRDELQSRGYKVVMTRTRQNVNISNQQRAQIGNQCHASAVIHLHCDGSNDSSTTGAHTIAITKNNPYCSNLYSASSSLAKKVINAYCQETGIKNKGVSYRDDLTGLNWSEVPAIYIEMGFLSNAKEDQLLTDDSFQKKCATGIANGIDQYLK